MNIPSQLIEVIDIALAGYRKENEAFIISIPLPFQKEQVDTKSTDLFLI